MSFLKPKVFIPPAPSAPPPEFPFTGILEPMPRCFLEPAAGLPFALPCPAAKTAIAAPPLPKTNAKAKANAKAKKQGQAKGKVQGQGQANA